MESENDLLETSEAEIQLQVNAANRAVDHLEGALRCIEQWLQYLPYKLIGSPAYSLCYVYSEPQIFHNAQDVNAELKRCIQYRAKRNREIDISGSIYVEVDAEYQEQRVNLSFGGNWLLFHVAGIIWFGINPSQPELRIDIDGPFTAAQMLPLYSLFQEAIRHQIQSISE